MSTTSEIGISDLVALIEAERERHWHKKQNDDGTWVRDERATMACLGCSRAHRVLDDLLFKLRPQIDQERQTRNPPPPRPCCDVCEP